MPITPTFARAVRRTILTARAVLPPVAAFAALASATLWAARIAAAPNATGWSPASAVLLVVLPIGLASLGGLSLLYWGALLDRAATLGGMARRIRAIKREVNHDPLTNLLNRREFFDLLDERLLAARQGAPLAVLIIDLDGFKLVNDVHGHEAGDAVLAEVGRRIRAATPESALVARLGGDEFAVALADTSDEETAAAAAQKVVELCSRPIAAQARHVHVGASVGVALAPLHATSRFDVMRHADAALYAAKSRGRNLAVVFDPEMEIEVRHRRFMERELKAALLCGEIEPHYQPIYAADGVTLVAGEALMRWKHPARGYIPPSDFIPLAEKANLINDLGAYLLRRACCDAGRWPGIDLHVNLSPLQIIRGDIVATVAEALEEFGLLPCRLVLEITESSFLDESDRALATLHRLRAIGVRIALDDFGTGYSALGYLRRFHFDKLKIDQSFIAGLAQSTDAATIVHAIVNLGRGLGMTVTAEGVETGDQHRFLRAAGCHEMQGFHFARPESAEDFELRTLKGFEEPLRAAS